LLFVIGLRKFFKGVGRVRKFVAISALCSVFVLAYIFVFSASNIQAEKPQEKKSQLKPGIYKAEYDKADFRGWKAFFSMEVDAAGEIKSSSFDYVNQSGQLKTRDTEYNNKMKSKSGLGPSEYCPRFAKNLQVYQDPNQIDAITGATMSSRDFKTFAHAAFNSAKTGDLSTIYIQQPETAGSNK
jgi:major membrane immunogen (membrane-anchored lipoprotein)